MKNINRREFLTGIQAQNKGVNDYSDNILVFVFLRGGMDGLSMLAPMTGHPDRVHYDALRTHGTQIPSNQLLSVGENFGMHPMATGLHELYQQNELAIVRAIGLPAYELNFSHFEAQRYAELGTPGIRHTIE